MLRANRLSPEFVLKNIAVLAQHPAHWPCISFCNHDIVRTVSRFGGGPGGDPQLAKLMLAVLLTLRGTTLLYQGEELGLPEVDLTRDQLRDPVGDLYYPVSKGRDGCRTPMPWDETAPNFGFSTGTPWLPMGTAHGKLAAASQEHDPQSVLNFARALLKVRASQPSLKWGDIAPIEAGASVLAYTRAHAGERTLCVFNMSRQTATFQDSRVANAAPIAPDCGHVRKTGDALALEPLSGWLGRL
jgi:alpha-glucosidase